MEEPSHHKINVVCHKQFRPKLILENSSVHVNLCTSRLILVQFYCPLAMSPIKLKQSSIWAGPKGVENTWEVSSLRNELACAKFERILCLWVDARGSIVFYVCGWPQRSWEYMRGFEPEKWFGMRIHERFRAWEMIWHVLNWKKHMSWEFYCFLCHCILFSFLGKSSYCFLPLLQV